MTIHYNHLFKTVLLLFGIMIFLLALGHAWNPSDGVAVCLSLGNQVNPRIDSRNLPVICWQDSRDTVSNPTRGTDIYVQSIDSIGAGLLKYNGYPVCAAINNQINPEMFSDGYGGAIITWEDYRNTTGHPEQGSDIYAQRIYIDGTTLWATDGIAICTAAGNQYSPKITPLPNTECMITWEDWRNGHDSDIYAQYVNSLGVAHWATNGILLCQDTGNQYAPRISSSLSLSAVVVWKDQRKGANLNDLYAVALNQNGIIGSYSSGYAVSTSNTVVDYSIIGEGAGNSIIAWTEWQNATTGMNIMAQRFALNGTPYWNSSGVSICTMSTDQYNVNLCTDGSSGAILTWMDERDGFLLTNIYSQRINSSGSTLWTDNGVHISEDSNFQANPDLVTDGNHGAYITWEDLRNNSIDIFAQRVDMNGNLQWGMEGEPVCVYDGNQRYPKIASLVGVFNPSYNQCFITWQDQRSGNQNTDIYTQNIMLDGTIPIITQVDRELWDKY